MTQWWTYGLSDFLMFSPQAYWRLVARYNEGWWPAQLLAALGPAALWLLLRDARAAAGRAALLLLAFAWAWLGWAFHWQRYSEIFLAASWVAAACGIEAVLLAATAALPVRKGSRERDAAASLLLAAALLYPLLAPLTGHPWNEAEAFAFMPEPSALATLGALLALHGTPVWCRTALAVIPLLSLLLGAATRWLIG
jgi:hypothetical protein